MILPIHNALKFRELCDENKVLICSTYMWKNVYNEIYILLKVMQKDMYLKWNFFNFFFMLFFLTHGAWFYNNVQCKLKWKLIWDFFNILNTYITSSSDLLLCISLKWTHLTLAQSHPKGKGTKQWSMKIHGHVCLCCGNSFYLSIQQ